MSLEITAVFLSNVFQSEQSLSDKESSTDVIVQLSSGEKYIASFFTFHHLTAMRQENLKTGDFIAGKYFWAKNMLLIDQCTEQHVRLVINHLLEEGDFQDVFEKL